MATTVRVASAVPVFPRASRAIARTRIVDPGAATGGTATMRSKGGAWYCEGLAPSTSTVTAVTATLSTACAVIFTSVPGSTSRGPVNDTAGGARSAAVEITAEVVATCDPPRP